MEINILHTTVLAASFVVSNIIIHKFFLRKYVKHSNRELKIATKEFNSDMSTQIINLSKVQIKFEILRKQYYELFARNYSRQETMSISDLQLKQSEAVAVEDYEAASRIQQEIDDIIKNENEATKDKNTDNS